MDIISFIKDPQLINDQSLSLPQETALRTFYGLPLTDEMLDIYRECTQLEEYPGTPYPEGDFVIGRRGGKSDKLASNIAIFEGAERGHERQLSPGEKGYIIIISPTKKQAFLILSYVKAKLQRSPILNSLVKDVYAEEVHLTNNLIIGSYVCSFRTLRGFSIPLGIIDEAAFLRVEGVNVDRDVLEAIRPAQAQFPGGKLIKISTPYAKQGVLWEDFQKYYGKVDSPILIWKASTSYMNPSISQEFLKKEEARDFDAYKREYLAQFSDSISDFLPSDIVDAAVIKDRFGLSYNGKYSYSAAIDAAFKGDSFTFALCHRDEEGRTVFDRLEGWRGTKSKPVHLKAVVGEIASILREYQTLTVHGDQYAAVPVKQAFDEEGITFIESTFSSNFKRELYSSLKHNIVDGKVELLDHPKSIQELKSLEVRHLPSGNTQIGHPKITGGSDDFATSIALASYKASTFHSVLAGLTDQHIFRWGEDESRVTA